MRLGKGLVAAGLALALGATGWWMAGAQEVSKDEIGDYLQTLARGRLPVFAAQGDLSRLYAFAAENGETLRWIPCTCGCGSLGHTSNRSCYVKAERGRQITYTSHAAT